MVPPPAPFFAAAAAAGAAKIALENRALPQGPNVAALTHGLFTAVHTQAAAATTSALAAKEFFQGKKSVKALQGPSQRVGRGGSYGRTFTQTKQKRRSLVETVCCYDMPYKYRPRPKWGRKRCFKKKTYRRRKPSIPYAVPARSQVVKFEMLTPATVSTNSTTASVIGTPILFAYNDVYSPDVQNTTFQPAGLDQWNNFYTYATVLWSKIDIIASSTVDDEILVGVTRAPYSRIQTGQQVPTAGDTIRQWGLDRSSAVGVISGDSDTVRISLTSNIRKCEQVADLSDNAPLYRSNISASSAQGAACTNKGYYYIWACAHDATSAQTVRLWVKMTYITRLHDPRTPDVSLTTT